MKTPDLYVITTGNAATGLGHINRCTTLCRNVRKWVGSIRFILPETDIGIDLPGFRVIFSQNRIADVLNQAVAGDHVIIDDYQLTAEDVLALSHAGLWTIGINDLPHDALPCHVTINHLPGIKKELFHAPHGILLLGTKYLLLKEEFIRETRSAPAFSGREGLLLAFGGTDPDGLTQKFLYAALESGIKPVHILTSALNQRLEELKKQSDGRTVYLHYGLNASEIIDLFKSCSHAILTASTLALEAMCVKINLAVGYTHDNQKLLAKTCAEEKTAINAGDLHLVHPEAMLKQLIASDPVSTSEAQFRMLRGASAENFMDILKSSHPYFKFCEQEHQNRGFVFKPFISLPDPELLSILQWRNHEDIRKWMLNSEPITETDHMRFIDRLRTDGGSGYWICYHNNEPLGVINTLKIDTVEGYCEPGYYLIPEKLQSGLGLKMATAFYDLLFNTAGYKVLGGYIHKRNISAMMNARAMGFESGGDVEINQTVFRKVTMRADQLRIFS